MVLAALAPSRMAGERRIWTAHSMGGIGVSMDLKRCDTCGTLESKTNPVNHQYQNTFFWQLEGERIDGLGIQIKVPIPENVRETDLCNECKAAEISKKDFAWAFNRSLQIANIRLRLRSLNRRKLSGA